MPIIEDENAAVIEPRKGKREEALPPRALMIFTPLDVDLVLRSFPEPPRRTHKIYLTDVYSGSYESVSLCCTGPMLGAPQTILVLEKLIALGVQEVVAIGWCGSIQPHVRIGDIVLPSGGLSEEGTSPHYPLSMNHPGPSPEVAHGMKTLLEEAGATVHEGRVWTTDAPFRETVGKVTTYADKGILAVDMETSALFTVGNFRGIRLAVVLAVSDELSTLKWVHGFKEPKFKTAREMLVQAALQALVSSSQYRVRRGAHP
jgi:uridine phosphorylase